MNYVIIVQLLFLLSILTTRTTKGCSCLEWPTLDTMILDETAYIFRGIVIPRFLSLFSSSTNDNFPSTQYTVWIQRVYKNGCDSDSGSANLSSFLLPRRQTIEIISPRNSCRISSLPIFRTFLFTGIVTASDSNGNDRSRTLHQDQEQSARYNSTILTEASNDIIQRHALRRTESTNVPLTMVMDVNLCGNFIQLWRTVTQTEKDVLSNLPSRTSNATTLECSGDN